MLHLLSQAADGAANCDRGPSVEGVGSPCLCLVAGLALPDANSLALHGVLAAEAAEVAGMLADLDLLDLLPQAGSISGAILAHNPDLLCAFGH